MGSHKKTSEDEGLARLTKALEAILKATAAAMSGTAGKYAGSGSWLGYTFAHHRRVFEGISDNKRLAYASIPRTRMLPAMTSLQPPASRTFLGKSMPRRALTA